MSFNKKVVITVAAGLALGMSSCRKYLDVNTNPNISPSATVQTLLPAGQLLVGSAMGVDLQINGSMWAGYWTQSPNASQYRSIEQYAPGQDAFSTPWENLYRANEQFYQLGKLADSGKRRHYKAISLLMRAYTFQVITDAWGDIPFTQALRGQIIDGGILNPKYDSQRTVYSGIMKYIDSAEKLIAIADPNGPGSDDLIYGGNMTRWAKFGYTLKLRMLMRLIEKDPTWAQAGLNALYSTPGVSFLGNGDDAAIAYGHSNTNNKNPLYAEASSATLGNIQNLVGSSTAIDSMNSNNDYRAYAFYTYLGNGSVAGIAQGNYDVSVPSTTYSLPSIYVGGVANDLGSANAPVNLLTSWESYFLQAEAIARGSVVTGQSDSTLFANGIAASFNYYDAALQAELGVDGASAFDIYINGDVVNSIPAAYWATYPVTGTATQKVRHIITAKWFSMCGNQGFEAWTELRRTGYPDFFVRSKNTLIGAQNPARFLYPTTESTRNASFPGLSTITTKTWWDL